MKRFIRNFTLVTLTFMLLVGSTPARLSAESSSPPPGFDQTAMEFVSGIRAGWNLGNSLDAIRWEYRRDPITRPQSEIETTWGNPLITRELIQLVNDGGFNAIRIPVSWRHFTGPGPYYVIDPALMSRVREVVDWAMDLDMYVMINIHHDGEIFGWLSASPNSRDQVLPKYERIWNQIATEFRDYNEKLIFESMNEVRENPHRGAGTYPNYRPGNGFGHGNVVTRGIINELNQTFVDTIRATGGNNHYRFLVIKPYSAWTTTQAFSNFVLPNNDDRLIIGAHLYENRIESATNIMNRLRSDARFSGVPIIIGEWGTRSNEGLSSDARVQHAAGLVGAATRHGIATFWWDDGGAFRLVDRPNNNWTINGARIVTAIMTNATVPDIPPPPPIYVSEFSGSNPNELITMLNTSDVILTTSGNLGIFPQHSPFTIPAGRTLTVNNTLNIQTNAELIVYGTLIIAEGGRVNNQGSSRSSGTIRIANTGTIINNGTVENATNSNVINYGSIENNGRFNIRGGVNFHNCGVVGGGNSLNIDRNANTTNCD